MSNFTQGPWEAWLRQGSSNYRTTGLSAAAAYLATNALKKDEFARNLYFELASQDGNCPGIALGRTTKEAKANACLMSAAPDLVAALQSAITEMEGLPHSLGYEFTHLPKMREALAKALARD